MPGYGAGDLDPAHTLADYVDRVLLPGRLIHGNRDPEGLFSTIPAVSTALAGALTGHLLRSDRANGYMKTAIMIVAGLTCIGIAHIWNSEFPINKNLWSSSFVLHCAGWSLLLLSVFYLVIDVWRVRAWATFFVVIGSNSILIYLARHFINFDFTASYFFEGAIVRSGIYEPLLKPSSVLLVEWLFLLVLYKKRVFVRV